MHLSKYYHNDYRRHIVSHLLESCQDHYHSYQDGSLVFNICGNEPQIDWIIIEVVHRLLGRKGSKIGLDTIILPYITEIFAHFTLSPDVNDKKQDETSYTVKSTSPDGFSLRDFFNLLSLADPLQNDLHYSPCQISVRNFVGNSGLVDKMGLDIYVLTNWRKDTYPAFDIPKEFQDIEPDPFSQIEYIEPDQLILDPFTNQPVKYEESGYVRENFSLWNGWGPEPPSPPSINL